MQESGIRGIQVLIDGIPMNDPGGNAPDMYDVDWETVKEIEVVKGLAASTYGTSGNGGVVNIITQDGGSKPIEDMLYATAGSYGFWKVLEQADGTEGNVNYRISYTHNQGDGYRQHQAFLGDNLNEKLNWTRTDKVKITQFITYTNYFNQNAEGVNLYRLSQPSQGGLQAPNIDAIPYNEFQKTQRLTAAFTGKFDISKKQDIQLKGFCRISDYIEQSDGGVDYKPSVNPGLSAQYDVNFGNKNLVNHISIGTDIESQVINEHEFGVAPFNQRDSNLVVSNFDQTIYDNNQILINQVIHERSIGLFFIDKLDISKNLFATLNVRYDNISNQLTDNMHYQTSDSSLSGEKTFQKPTYNIGLTYNLCKNSNIYANWGTGFLAPAGDELYNNPKQWGGFNTGIVPQTSQGEEIGIRGDIGKKVYYDIDAFEMATDNEYYRYLLQGRGNISDFYSNIGKSNRWGIEAALAYSPVDPLKIQLAYTYSHFQYLSPDSVKNHWIPECPQNMLDAEVSLKFAKHFTFIASAEWQSKWCFNVDPYIYNTFTLGATWYQPEQVESSWVKGYNIYGTELKYSWKLSSIKGEVSFRVKNIFNTVYFGYTEPDFYPQWNCFQTAPGREFFGSLKIVF
jgi:iron complex outermembrane receptor protein